MYPRIYRELEIWVERERLLGGRLGRLIGCQYEGRESASLALRDS